MKYHRYENRFWLYGKKHRTLLNLEWSFGRQAKFCCIDLEWFKGFKSPSLSIGLPFLFWIHIHLFDRDEWADYELALKVHNGSVWLNLFSNPMESSSKDPWYRKTYSLNFADFFLGRHKYTKEILRTEPVQIPMPEGIYHGTAEVERCTWKRSRWPFKIVKTGCWISVPNGGVPHPGKGENSWDCGMDGICGTGVSEGSVEDGIGRFVAAVLRNRQRYAGSRDWTPQKESAA